MTAGTEMLILNVGNVFTLYPSGCEETIPDLSLAPENIVSRITNWRVVEDYTSSDPHGNPVRGYPSAVQGTEAQRPSSVQICNFYIVAHDSFWLRPEDQTGLLYTFQMNIY